MSQTTLSLAKTTRPTLSMVSNRERLFTQLDDHAAQKAIWISGPPGSGKTTVIASYLQARTQTALWYQLDASDADVATFFHYSRRSAVKHSKDSTANIPELPHEENNWPKYGHRFFRAIFSRFSDPLTIVFDNYESLPPHSDLHSILAKCIDEVPAGAKLVFVSRADPPSPFARARINGSLAEIGSEALRLTGEEFTQLTKLRAANVSDDAAEEIRRMSAGWIAFAILMIEHSKQSKALGSASVSSSGGVLFDYVAEEVFSNFDTTTRNFLLKVCWPRRLSVNIAKALSGETATHQLLANLARNNYFVTERDDSVDCEYVFHPLLREFLQAQAKKSLDEPTIIRIQQHTAELLADEGHPEEAVELLAANLDWDRLEPIIGQHAPLLLQQGRTTMLSKWLEELPRDRLDNNAWLLFWFGKARHHDSPREARNYFTASFRCFERESEPDGDGRMLACCGVVEAIFTEADDYSLLDDWTPLLLDFLDETEPSRRDDLIHVEIVALLALALRNPGQVELAERLRRADKLLRQMPEPDHRVYNELPLALAYSLTGQYERADEVLTAFGENAPGSEQPRVMCNFLLLCALNHVLGGNADAAHAASTECLALLDENSLPQLLPFVHAGLSAAALIRRDLDCADDWLSKLAGGSANGQRLPRFLHHYLTSWRALVGDDIIKAHHEQRNAQACAVELGISFLEVISSTAFAQLLFMCEDVRGGTAQLRRVHSIARDVQNPLLEFMTLLIYSEVAMREGRASSGTNALRYALGLGRRHGYYHVPWWHPQQLAAVCVAALQQNIEVDYVRDFVIRGKLQPIQPPLDVAQWPWPLIITTLGGLSIKQLNDVDAPADKSRGRPLQLLKVLIALGGREVAAEDVATILWPHVDREYSNKSLTINLHRLRRTLGDDDSILLLDGRLSLNEKLTWVDCWALEHIVVQIESALRIPGKRRGEPKLDYYRRRLMEIYQGSFMVDDDSATCITAAREKYRDRFISGLEMLAQTASAETDTTQQIELYESGILREPTAEPLYRGLMTLYRNLNRQDEARQSYERCRQAVAATPQKTPSKETNAIYQLL